jgi:hypothetical protein
MSICEFLHCSYSELPSRCPSLVDKEMIMRYLIEKVKKEEYAGKMPSPKTTPRMGPK